MIQTIILSTEDNIIDWLKVRLVSCWSFAPSVSAIIVAVLILSICECED